jgi:hypothetical protein
VAPASFDENVNEGDEVVIVEPPAGPVSMVVSGMTVSTLNVREAGVASGLPAGSIARTWKVWEPSASELRLRGDVQAAKAPASSRHSKLAAPSGDEKLNVAEFTVIVEPPAGPESIEVSGATVSTVKLRLAGVASGLPAGSIARTWNVWEPSPRALRLRGDVQTANEPESSLHSKVAPASFDEKVNDGEALVIVELSAGPESMVVFGTIVSTVKVREAGV